MDPMFSHHQQHLVDKTMKLGQLCSCPSVCPSVFPAQTVCPLVFVSCLHINTLGYLTVEPPSPFLKGSDLTVFCHLTTCQSR